MDTLGIASSGLTKAAARVDAAAWSLTEEPIRREMPSGLPLPPLIAVVDETSAGDQSLDKLIEASTSAVAYKANANVIKAYDTMMGTLIDTVS